MPFWEQPTPALADWETSGEALSRANDMTDG
jgi:hypothetical protein